MPLQMSWRTITILFVRILTRSSYAYIELTYSPCRLIRPFLLFRSYSTIDEDIG